MNLDYLKHYRKTRYDKYIIGLLILTVLYGITGFFILPPLAKKTLINKLSQAIHRKVSIDKIKINPFTLSVSVDKFRVIDKDNLDFISFDNIFVDFEAISAFKRALVFKELSINVPFVRIELKENGSYNFSDIIKDMQQSPEPKAGATLATPEAKIVKVKKTSATSENQAAGNSSPLNVIIQALNINGGRIIYIDKSLGQTFSTDLLKLRLEIKDFAIVSKGKSSYNIMTLTESKEQIEVQGLFTATPPSMDASVRLTGIVLKKYAPYMQDMVNFKLADGIMNMGFNFNYKAQPSGDIMKVENGDFELKSLELNHRENGENFLSISSLALKNILVDLAARKVNIGSFTTNAGYLLARLTKTGEFNLARAFQVPITAKKEPVKKEPAKPSPPWHVKVENVLLDDYSVRFEDMTPAQPVKIRLTKIKFKTQNLAIPSPPEGHPLYFKTRYEQSGEITADGKFKIGPVEADLKIKISDIDLRPLQPYMAQQTKLVVKNGNFGGDCSLHIKMLTSGDINLSLLGDVSIKAFSASLSDSGMELIRWDDLNVLGLETGYNPTVTHIKEVRINRLYSFIVLEPDGTINLINAVSAPAQKPPERSAGSSPAKSASVSETSPQNNSQESSFALDTVSVSNGKIDFTDNYVAPNYKAALSELVAKVSGIFAKDSMATIALTGKMNNYSPVKMAGKINLADYTKYLDLDVDCKEIGLVPLTPYSSRFVGYLMQKGKLSLGLKYKIRNKNLDAQNRIYMDQLTFGDKVKSPDATSLPVRLAVSLLKDRNGIINLDVPVSGDLSDPKVNIWKLIWKVLSNLIKKIGTAPFAALGSVVGGGEELQYIDFQPGLSDLDDAQKKKLDKLIDALYERPSLSLEIQGNAGSSGDYDAIKHEKLNQMLIEEKRKKIVETGESAPATSEIQISRREYEKYLRMVYERGSIKKPDAQKAQIEKFVFERVYNPLFESVIAKEMNKKKFLEQGDQKAKPLTIQEIELMLLNNIEIPKAELRQLALNRANIVMSYIVTEGRTAAERLSVVAPVIVDPSSEQKSGSRVVFSLK